MVALMKHVPHHRVDDQFRIIKLLVEEDSNVNYKTRVCISHPLSVILFAALCVGVGVGACLSVCVCVCVV